MKDWQVKQKNKICVPKTKPKNPLVVPAIKRKAGKHKDKRKVQKHKESFQLDGNATQRI